METLELFHRDIQYIAAHWYYLYDKAKLHLESKLDIFIAKSNIFGYFRCETVHFYSKIDNFSLKLTV